MDRYTLSYEGRMRFRRAKISVNQEEEGKIEGYEVLDYLYEHGTATVEEIENNTGLSWGQVVEKITTLMYWGYIEKLAEQ